MTRVRWLAVIALVALACAARGEDPAPPDPLQLKPDWWSYFTPDPEATSDSLELRVERAVERLEALRPEVPEQERDTLVPLIDALGAGLRRYQAFSAEPMPVAPPAQPVQERYTLDEVRELVTELRGAGVSLAAEREEISLLEEALQSGQRELNQRKVAYRALEATSPKRLRQGLEQMEARLQLELGKLELAWREAGVDVLQSRVEHLEELSKSAVKRLVSTADAVEEVARQKAEAKHTAESIRQQLLKSQLAQSGTLALSAKEQQLAKLAAQKVLELEVAATREEVVALQYAVAERILQRVAADNELAPGPDRDFLKEQRQRMEAASDKIPRWRQAAARSREAALAQESGVSPGAEDRVLEQLRETADSTERWLRDLEQQLIGAGQFGDLLDALLAERETRMTRGLQVAEDWAGWSWSELGQLVTTTLFELGGTPVTAADLFRVILILAAAWWLSSLLRRGLQRFAARRDTVNQSAIYTLGRVLHYIILAAGIMIALSSVGIDFTKFALFASALGVGIGFGLQTLVSNFVAGLIILFERSLKIGDFVEMESGVTGEVTEINMRSTLITTNDNIDILVPNSEFVNGRVTNWTMREVYRRVHVPFGVAYGTDKDLVKKAILEAAAEVPFTLTNNPRRAPQLWFVEFGDSSLNFELVVWLTPDAVKRPGAVQAQYLWEIDNKLRKYGIEVPFPQRDLHLRSMPAGLDVPDGS